MTRAIASSVAIAIAAATLAALPSCAHAKIPPPDERSAVTVTQSLPTARTSDQTVSLSKEIRSTCRIDDSDHAPKFDFDSTLLAGNDRDLLQKVATCLTTGELKGKAMKLVGRADPRGEAEYNMNLGESRATSVRQYLLSLGVAETRMRETSRGALDAMGHDEDTWRKDRRVDIVLAP